jgi:hypothetical protein
MPPQLQTRWKATSLKCWLQKNPQRFAKGRGKETALPLARNIDVNDVVALVAVMLEVVLAERYRRWNAKGEVGE